MLTPQLVLPIADEIVCDLFAGGGGMSTAIEQAIGRHADIAINHNDDALSMHRVNHPQTRHFVADVFEVCPKGATQGRPVGLLHLSPDCTEHSQAKGGQPRDRKIRALSWVGARWAGQVRPRIITLENVRQILKWGPLIAKRDPATGRVVRVDYTVAEPGERVPLREQYLIPDPRHAGRTWRRFVATLEAMGYAVEHRMLCAADFGAPTTRERLFMVARRDGLPIRWPDPTHHKKPARGQKRWRPAADCIDWTLRCPSIFDRKRPLADATLRRVAVGVQRYVIEAAEPFIVPIANWSRDGVQPVSEPLRTITAWPRGGSFAVVAPTLVQTGYGERDGQAPRALDLQAPLGTIVAGGAKHGLVTAFLAQHNNHRGGAPNVGRDLREPVPTIVSAGTQGLVTAHLAHLRNHCDGRSIDEPLRTLSAGGEHHGVVQCTLSPDLEAGALRVAAFLMRYHGSGGQWADARDPMTSITTRDRLALVTVVLHGTPYVIVDIGLRMLQPHELYAAQGFPPDYIVDCGHDGRRLTKGAQVRMVGNSVSPPPAEALIRVNFAHEQSWRRAA